MTKLSVVSFPLPRASFTNSAPIFSIVDISLCKFMASVTELLSCVFSRGAITSEIILLWCNFFEVPRIYTQNIFTKMVNLKPFFYSPTVKLVRKSMSWVASYAIPKRTVFFCDCPFPIPTRFCFFNFCKKSLYSHKCVLPQTQALVKVVL